MADSNGYYVINAEICNALCGLYLVLPGRSRLNSAQNNVIHRLVTVVNASARLDTAVYSCKTLAVRARMRLSITEKHPGDLLLTVMESFSEYYVSGLRKLEKLVVPCSFSRISLRCCLPLRELGL